MCVHVFNVHVLGKLQVALLDSKDFMRYPLSLQNILYSCFSEAGICGRIALFYDSQNMPRNKKNPESDSLIPYANFALTFYKVIPGLQNSVGKYQPEDLYTISIYSFKLQENTLFVVLY